MTGMLYVPVLLVGGPFDGRTVDAVATLITPALELVVEGHLYLPTAPDPDDRIWRTIYGGPRP